LLFRAITDLIDPKLAILNLEVADAYFADKTQAKAMILLSRSNEKFKETYSFF
jgi:hypothetical protein